MSLVNYISSVTYLVTLSTEGSGGKTLLFICHHSSTGNLVYSAMEFFKLSCLSLGRQDNATFRSGALPLFPLPHMPPPLLTPEQSLSLLFLSCHVFFIYNTLPTLPLLFSLLPISSTYLEVQSPLLYVHTEDNTIGQVIQLLLTRALVTSQAHVS